MRWFGIVLLIGLTGGMAAAEEPPATTAATPAPTDADRDAQIASARAEAALSISRQIEGTPLTSSLTVREFLANANGVAALREMVASADEVGGPRWLDDEVAQVRLTVSGNRVADKLRLLAGSDTTQLSQIEPALAEMAQREFSATGTSIATANVQAMQVVAPVPDAVGEAQSAAIDSARYDASVKILHSIAQVAVGSTTLGAIWQEPQSDVTRDVMDFLSTRPVTGIETRDDSRIELKLSVPPGELYDVLRASLTSRKHSAAPQDDAGWARLRADLFAAMGEPIGTGYVAAGSTTAQTVAPVAEPRVIKQMPGWVREQIDAAGSSEFVTSRLHTARQAERIAIEQLRKQVEELPIDDTTLGEWSRTEPRIAQAVDRAMVRARTFKTDYFGDGSVVVKVSLDLRYVWEELIRR